MKIQTLISIATLALAPYAFAQGPTSYGFDCQSASETNGDQIEVMSVTHRGAKIKASVQWDGPQDSMPSASSALVVVNSQITANGQIESIEYRAASGHGFQLTLRQVSEGKYEGHLEATDNVDTDAERGFITSQNVECKYQH